MDLKKEFEEIKQELCSENKAEVDEQPNDAMQVQETSNNTPVTFEDAKNQALAEFKPKYDHTKSMYENGKDIVRTIGLNEALKDDKFIGEVAEGAKKEIKTDIDTDQKDADKRNQKSFYDKHKPVLSFARMKEPCDLSLMKWTYAIAVIPYILSLIVGEIFNLIIRCFEAINDLFNAIIGIPEYYINKETGELVLDDKGNPITKTVKVNLLTKIIFWFCFVMICLVTVFAVVRGLTGFDIVQAIKNLLNG